jgi:glycosyltransferase involved in cell wall biosynthesis
MQARSSGASAMIPVVAAVSRGTLILHGQDHDLRNSGGVGRYAYELRRRACATDRRYLIDVDIRSLNFPPLDANLERADSFAALKRSLRGSLPSWAIRSARRMMHRARRPSPPVTLPDPARPAVFHEMTGYTSHVTLPELARAPQVRICVTFHDLQDLYYPDYFEANVRKARDHHYQFYKRHAQRFFAISEFTKRSMVDQLEIPADRITVTPMAADGFDRRASPAATARARTLGRYLIYPAKLWRHKNHEFLLKAFAQRRGEFSREGIRLLLTGGFGRDERSRLGAMVRKHGLGRQVVILGFESHDSFLALIQNAEFMVFPSLFEGFGMPVLEAMQASCPVLCSNRGSLPEIGADCVAYFDPGDEASLVSAFDRVLDGTIDRAALIEKGRERSARFTWDRTFEVTAAEYSRLF